MPCERGEWIGNWPSTPDRPGDDAAACPLAEDAIVRGADEPAYGAVDAAGLACLLGWAVEDSVEVDCCRKAAKKVEKKGRCEDMALLTPAADLVVGRRLGPFGIDCAAVARNGHTVGDRSGSGSGSYQWVFVGGKCWLWFRRVLPSGQGCLRVAEELQAGFGIGKHEPEGRYHRKSLAGLDETTLVFRDALCVTAKGFSGCWLACDCDSSVSLCGTAKVSFWYNFAMVDGR